MLDNIRFNTISSVIYILLWGHLPRQCTTLFWVFIFGCHLGPWSPTYLGCIKLITHYYCCDNGKQIRTKHDQLNYKKYKTKERMVKRWH